MKMLKDIYRFLLRYQEKLIFLPLLVCIGLVGWIVFGALDRTAAIDTMAAWINLPARTAYAVAALSLVYILRRRWRKTLTDEEQKYWWNQLMDSKPGAIVVLITDAAVTICALYFLLKFFSLPS